MFRAAFGRECNKVTNGNSEPLFSFLQSALINWRRSHASSGGSVGNLMWITSGVGSGATSLATYITNHYFATLDDTASLHTGSLPDHRIDDWPLVILDDFPANRAADIKMYVPDVTPVLIFSNETPPDNVSALVGRPVIVL